MGWRASESQPRPVASKLIPAFAALALSACANPELTHFERVLAASDSATLALEQWCEMGGLAEHPTVTIEPVVGERSAVPDTVRNALQAGEAEEVGFRHVRLVCGETVMSDARNWFVPARLTPEMNEALALTNAPFGKIVAPLQFKRERLKSMRGAATGCPKGTILSHRARLTLPDGRPISYLLECYTPANVRRR